ncbi:hypothetical protein SLS58_005778 [Diplodia intermedia]|uniref:Uncharacterized protein n=1 Tax=Diplodia intermedia TaxID=856260 RepID=A0ABR3TQ49_9PEZI
MAPTGPSEAAPAEVPQPCGDTSDPDFERAPATFQLASSAAAQHRKPAFLFVHVDGASEKKHRSKPRTREREVRSHIMIRTNENKRRAGVEVVGRHHQHAIDHVAARIQQQAIRDVGTGRIDPFDTLPVRETPVYRKTVEFFFFHMPIQIPYSDDELVLESRTVSPPAWAKSFWRLANDEPATFLAILYYTAVVYGSLPGIEMSAEHLLWAQRALEMIRDWIASGGPITDSLACAVASLATSASIQGQYEVSDKHYIGLLAIVNARGGISTFEPFIRRGLIWCEFYYRIRHMTVPVLHQELSPESLQQCRASFPPALQHEALRRHRLGQRRLPRVGADLDLILLHLHHLSIVQDPAWGPHADRAAMRNLLYDCEHKLLVILAAPPSSKPDRGEDDASVSPARRVRSAVAQAAQMFLLAALREMPLRRALYDLLAERLTATICVPDAVDQWMRVAHLHSLVWVLFVGWVLSARGIECRAQKWFQERLTQTMWQLDLRSCEDLDAVLAQFPSTDAFCGEPFRQLRSMLSVIDEEGGAGHELQAI